jgi:hypothetical protein
MIKNLLIIVFFACLLGCSNKEVSPTIHNFSPTVIVENWGLQNSIVFLETGKRQQWNSSYIEKNWHYFSASKVDNIEIMMSSLRNRLKERLVDLENNVHGSGESSHAFIVYELSYSQGSRNGTLKITTAKIENGTAIDISLFEF